MILPSLALLERTDHRWICPFSVHWGEAVMATSRLKRREGPAGSGTARTGIDLEAGLLSDYRFEKVNDPFKARMKK